MSNGDGQGQVYIPASIIPASGKVCMVTVCAEDDTIHSLSRVAAGLFTNPSVAAMRRYLPQNQDLGLLQEMKNADLCVCLIDFDLDRDLAIETATSFQQLLGTKVMPIAMSRKSSSSLMKWEFPRLCRGGSQTLRIPGVYLPLLPSFLPKPRASRASCRCSCFSPVAIRPL
jgi:hypothetical protein